MMRASAVVKRSLTMTHFALRVMWAFVSCALCAPRGEWPAPDLRAAWR